MAASRHECSICMDSFKNPKLISCHHSFCYKCLEDYVQVNLHNGRFNCPICRKSVKLPDKGISGFQSNFYIDTEKNESFPCDICGPKNMACSRCLDCDENLCQSCCFVHEKSKFSRHHKISDLVTLDPEMKGKIRQRAFCDQHPEEEIKLVCQDCKVPICLMCKAVEHDGHPTKSLADVVTKVKMTLDTKLNQCSDKLRRIKASTVKGEELDRSINDAEQEELKAVDDQCSQLHKAIDQEAAKFKDEIKNIYRLLKEQNAVFRSYMEEEFKSCSDTKDIAQNLRDQGTDIEIIKKGPDIEEFISAAIAKTDPTPTVRLTNKLFSPATIIASKLIPLIAIMQNSTDAFQKMERRLKDFERELASTKKDYEKAKSYSQKMEIIVKYLEEELCRTTKLQGEAKDNASPINETLKQEEKERQAHRKEHADVVAEPQSMETTVKYLKGELDKTKELWKKAKANAIEIGEKLNRADEIHDLRNHHAHAVAEVTAIDERLSRAEKAIQAHRKEHEDAVAEVDNYKTKLQNKQIEAYRKKCPSSRKSNEKIKSWLCTECQGWKRAKEKNKNISFNCDCDGNK